MAIYYSGKLKPLAQSLRKNMTRQERRLWYEFLSEYPARFRRQKQFGPYIVDFYCSSAKLIVELDGGQHFMDKKMQYDRERTMYLERLGYKVIRISNNEVDQNFNGVCEWIDLCVRERGDAFPSGEGGTAQP
ncbi:MAG: endonuclease domain-containing protein [Oscillospiraceae bacterium]|nr:endonuclease domain-containing protein [Oscillospiraceae bacterium]